MCDSIKQVCFNSVGFELEHELGTFGKAAAWNTQQSLSSAFKFHKTGYLFFTGRQDRPTKRSSLSGTAPPFYSLTVLPRLRYCASSPSCVTPRI